jgi:hypothetical protein
MELRNVLLSKGANGRLTHLNLATSLDYNSLGLTATIRRSCHNVGCITTDRSLIHIRLDIQSIFAADFNLANELLRKM